MLKKKLILEKIRIKDIRFGNITNIQDGILTICREEMLGKLSSEKLTDVAVDLARPGESVRIVPVKDVIQPRIKKEKGTFFPGVLGPADSCGEGVTRVLEGCNVVTAGSIIFYQEGIIDMDGPGAEYTIFSKYCNVVLSAKPAEGLSSTDHEKEMRLLGLKAAHYLASCTMEKGADDIEEYELAETKEKLPKVAYVYLLLAQGLLHDNYLYGMNMQKMHPMFMHPNEFMDGAVVSGNCVTACDKTTTFDHMNNPVIRTLYEKHGKELEFVGVIASPVSPVLADKERCSMGVKNLAQLLKLDGAVVSEEGGGNPESDLMMICEGLEESGIKTVLMAHENCGKEGTAQGITIVSEKADAVVTAGNTNVIITLPPVGKVIGVPEAIEMLSGAPEHSLQEDGSIRTAMSVMMGSINNIGTGKLGMEEY